MDKISFYDYMMQYANEDSPAGKLARNMQKCRYQWQACSFEGGIEVYGICFNEYMRYCKGRKYK